MDYRTAGVNIEAGDRAKKNIAALARSTHGPNVLKGIGLFGGFYEFPANQYREPVLVASTDGIGTKIKLASQLGEYRGLGVDIVNHCVNDIMVGGADPLFFLDYLAFGKLEQNIVAELITGMTEACRTANCALIGGETAEMPDLYSGNDFDLAGTIVGAVEKSKIIDGSAISAGDVLLGLASNGLHTNGYSLARKIIASHADCAPQKYHAELGETIVAALLRPHRSYYEVIRALRDLPDVTGFAHITGGGIVGNTKRLLREGLSLAVNWQAWEWPPLFKLLQHYGKVAEEEMRNVFNLGIGLVVLAKPESLESVQMALRELNEKHWHVGDVVRA
ncbi:phosphoribosylformylglycinamidine cyclo-ligase [candidate division KSB1 bacterium]|nr:phosphoribosylformylglycinamidine cyclo-ligase [candidate division KSB1 bacterium]